MSKTRRCPTLLDNSSELGESRRPVNFSVNVVAHLAQLIELFVNSEPHRNGRFEGARDCAGNYPIKRSEAAAHSTRQIAAHSTRQIDTSL
jgi:hypothetical protein